jgi:hypothetical protein
MSKVWKRGSTFLSAAPGDYELYFNCALACFGYRVFRLPTNVCLKAVIKRICFAPSIVQADSFACLDYLPASDSLRRDTKIGRARKGVDWMKHQWLYLNELDSANSVRKFVAFYVEQYNSVVPHFAFQGQTPDEMYFVTGANVPVDLQEKRATARALRLAHNCALNCDLCRARTREPSLVAIQSNTN